MLPKFDLNDVTNLKQTDSLPCECKRCHTIFDLSVKRVRDALNSKIRFTGDYCSIQCANANKKTGVTMETSICVACRSDFTHMKCRKSKFCCKSCAATYNNQNKTHGTRRSKLETFLETQLILSFPELDFHFNRKDAINSELDIYIPSLRLAFELNGIFHYEPIYGPEKLSQIQNNDTRKFQACLEQGIELCIIDSSTMKNFKEHKARFFLSKIETIIKAKL